MRSIFGAAAVEVKRQKLRSIFAAGSSGCCGAMLVSTAIAHLISA